MDFIQLLDCTNTDLLPIIRFVKNGVFPIIQIGVPILLIIMGSIDLGKAVLSSDDKEIKGATGRLIKRVVSAIAIFFVVTVVKLVMNMFAGTGVDQDGNNTNDWWACWSEAKSTTKSADSND